MIFRRLFERLAVSAAMSLALFAVPAFAGGPAVVSAAPTAAPAAPDRERVRMNQRVFDHVWNEVRREYYDPHLHGVDWNAARRNWRPMALAAPDDRTLYRSLRDMLNLLDDEHAGAAPPAVARRQDQLRERRAAVGLSLRADRDNQDSYRVEQVREGSPAAEAGVGVGWRLIANGATGWTPEQEVVEGQPLVLAMIDADGAARPTILNPRVMEPRPAFVADRTRPNVLVLRVEGFEQGLGLWMGEQLAGLAPDTDVILDLRGNSGGRLMEADAVLSCFLPTNLAWATRTSRNGRRVELKTAGGCGALTGPVANDVAVLVDDQSRSAAELTPAALQEAHRALVVGAPTAGAVLISQETRLPDGGRLTLSRADFVTSGGVRLEKHGVTPDLAAIPTAGDRGAGRDAALEAAVAALAAPRAEQAQAVAAALL